MNYAESVPRPFSCRWYSLDGQGVIVNLFVVSLLVYFVSVIPRHGCSLLSKNRMPYLETPSVRLLVTRCRPSIPFIRFSWN